MCCGEAADTAFAKALSYLKEMNDYEMSLLFK